MLFIYQGATIMPQLSEDSTSTMTITFCVIFGAYGDLKYSMVVIRINRVGSSCQSSVHQIQNTGMALRTIELYFPFDLYIYEGVRCKWITRVSDWVCLHLGDSYRPRRQRVEVIFCGQMMAWENHMTWLSHWWLATSSNLPLSICCPSALHLHLICTHFLQTLST